MITDVADFFAKGCGRCERFATPDCSARHWAEGLDRLRRICLALGLVETAKWGHPCYMHNGRNIVVLGASRRDIRLNFFDAALMTDPAGRLEKQGPNTRHKNMLRFTSDAQVAASEPLIRDYLEEAKGHAEAGTRPARDKAVGDLPQELVTALEADRELADAFHRLTPGRQRSYVVNLGTAKTTATRMSRIARFRPKILAGKGALDR